MSTRFASTINTYDIAAKRAECDYSGTNIEQNYAKKTEIKNGELLVRYGDEQYSSLFSANADTNAYLDLRYRTYTVSGGSTTFAAGLPTLADMQAIYTQPDWDASSGVAQILNKPTIPTVNDGTLTIQQGSTSLGTFSANQSSSTTITIPDPPALPKRYWQTRQDLALSHAYANDYYDFAFAWPSTIDTDNDYIVHFQVDIAKPKTELTQLNLEDMPFIIKVMTDGSFNFASSSGIMTCNKGSFANYEGSAVIQVHIPHTYFSVSNNVHFITYFPNNILTVSDTFQFNASGYFVEAP